MSQQTVTPVDKRCDNVIGGHYNVPIANTFNALSIKIIDSSHVHVAIVPVAQKVTNGDGYKKNKQENIYI